MQRIRLIGLAFAAVCAISAIIAASAGAAVFLANKTGLLLGKALATQKFLTHAGLVECTALTAHGTVTSLKTKKQKAIISYTGCKAFGLAAKVSPAEYEFDAEGKVTILKTITVTATGCTVTVPGGQTVGPVKYLNKVLGEIEIEPNVGGITSVGVGPACEYAEESVGTYTGNSLVQLDGGHLIWDA
jgi:hypothetical protein